YRLSEVSGGKDGLRAKSCSSHNLAYLMFLRTAIEKERAALESFIKSDRTVRELKRAIAVRIAIEGKLYHEISKIWRVSKFFIGYWTKQFKTKGSQESN
ncbi:hypothetical protein QT970_06725, partial [Microcoleus sp. herbarium8]